MKVFPLNGFSPLDSGSVTGVAGGISSPEPELSPSPLEHAAKLKRIAVIFKKELEFVSFAYSIPNSHIYKEIKPILTKNIM